MKHGVSGYKLKRDAGSRKALLKGLVTSVIEHERVITTIPKAKAVQPLVDKMITLAKRDTLHSRRLRPARMSRVRHGNISLYSPAWGAANFSPMRHII